VFDQARKCLEARSKQLKKEGKGNKPNAGEALTNVEENILYEKNLLGISNAEALLNTVWLFNSVSFGLRDCEEHGQMTWGDVQLHMEADGIEYLEYSESQTKLERELNLVMSVLLNQTLSQHQTVHLKEIQLLITRFTPKSDLTR